MFVIEITCVAQIELMTAFTKGSSKSVGSGTWPRKRLPHKGSFTDQCWSTSVDPGTGAANDVELERLYYTFDDDQVAAIVSAFGTFDPRQLDDEAQIEIRRAWRLAHLCGGARGPRNPLEGSCRRL